MKRRNFLKTTVPAVTLPAFLGGFNINAYGASPLLNLLAKAAANTGRTFVIIQLNGGNDGLNTVIPLDQYSNLSNARGNVLIPENKVLKLNGTSKTGLHPAMTGLRELYDNGYVSIVQDAGYPNPNFSHFRSTDIWLTSSDADDYVSTGWLGRYLGGEYPTYPDGFPNTDTPDPLAIQIGAMVSPAFQGPDVNMGIAITDPSTFYQFINGVVPTAPSTPAGHELTYIRLVAQQTQQYGAVIKAAATSGQNLSTKYPADNYLADQLKIVAQLISGGLQTPLYMVSISGFDTHALQVEDSDTTQGAHAELLKMLSGAIAAFQDDLKLLGKEDMVAGMTFSEFGRRIKSNASRGTDHGAAAPVICFGKNVIPGIIGNSPVIPSSVSVSDNVPMQYDFRQVYASVLADWFHASPTEVSDAIGASFNTLPIFKKYGAGIAKEEHSAAGLQIRNYPNPVASYTWLEINSTGGYLEIKLYDGSGRMVNEIASGNYAPGSHKLYVETATLRPGNYYYQVRQQNAAVTGHLLKL